MRRSSALGLLVALLSVSSSPPLRAQAPVASPATKSALGEGNPDLRAGIAAVTAGDYAEGVASLSRAVRQLGPDPSRQSELVQAYLHLGVAFAGLGQESPALSQFTQALLRQPEATLTVKGAPELARRLFDEARREAAPVIAAAKEGKKKGSKTPMVLVGVAAVGAGVGVAIAAGGEQASPPPPPIVPADPGPDFRFASANGNPFLSFVGGEPASGSTIQVGTARPRFRFRAQVSTFGAPIGPFARLQVTIELGTFDRGVCWRAASAPFALAAGPAVEVVIDSFPATPACPAPFSTLTVDAKLFDLDTARQMSNSVYTGGYKVVP